MIGEINGQAINSEMPINGLSPRLKFVVVGFSDSLFPDRGLEFRSSFPVAGFTDSVVFDLQLWDARRESQIVSFCSPKNQTVFTSLENACRFPTSVMEFRSPAMGTVFESCPPSWARPSDDAAVEFNSQDSYGAFTSTQNMNTRGEC